MLNYNSPKQIRIQFIDELIRTRPSTLEEILNYVNQKLISLGMETIKIRMLNSHIKSLRLGDFIYSNAGIRKNKKGWFFNLIYENKLYRYPENAIMPEFGDLEEDERLTIPFLIGILKNYENIPAVSKIMANLIEDYKIDEEEMACSSAVIVTKPSLINEEDIISLAIKILGNIKREECIEFNYIDVNQLDDNKNKSKWHQVSPLQIRLYENIYYLTAAVVSDQKKYIVNYRLDQIFKLQVDVLLDQETEEIIHFNYKELAKFFKLKDYFKYSIGIWNHRENEKIEDIKIKFKGWAASYVKKMPLHHSQKIISIDKLKNEMTVIIKIKLLPYSENANTVFKRAPELSFLLGRFRDFFEIVN
jgi:isopentenyldiphosphate isomerase